MIVHGKRNQQAPAGGDGDMWPTAEQAVDARRCTEERLPAGKSVIIWCILGALSWATVCFVLRVI